LDCRIAIAMVLGASVSSASVSSASASVFSIIKHPFILLSFKTAIMFSYRLI
jgi:hypothetical protein